MYKVVASIWSGVRPAVMAALIVGCFGMDDPIQAGGCLPEVSCAAAPVAVTGGHQFTSLAAGQYHTCGLKSNGEVWCWGLNTGGQLGATTPELSSGTPVRVGGQTTFTSIAAGDFHTCGIGSDAGAYCWGSNLTSVLGVETVTETCGGAPCSRTPVRAGGAALTVTALDAGATHNCALDSSGTARCWGYNVLGELGSSTFRAGFFTPQTIQGGPFSAVSAGYQFNCALDSGGTLYCWGAGQEGQLVTLDIDPCGTTSSDPRCSTVPVIANTSLTFSSVTTGVAFGCGLTTTGAVHCWGRNNEGQLGNGVFVSSATPVAVQTTGAWDSVVAGYFHACALRSNGAAFCWGVNNSAQLGDGSTVFAHAIPQQVQGGKTFTQLAAGSIHTCGLATDGAVWCWGNNEVKQLGGG
jgi:alpha-tubulin suppressor-like RCC1 family protein